MQKILTSSLFIALLASSSAFAEDQHNPSQVMGRDGMQQMESAAIDAMHDEGQSTKLTDGVVKNVDQKRSTITLQHGEIVNINMPAMTMRYRVKQVQQLESIHAGDKVRFALDKLNNNYIVTHIEVTR